MASELYSNGRSAQVQQSDSDIAPLREIDIDGLLAKAEELLADLDLAGTGMAAAYMSQVVDALKRSNRA
ncbi:hypothetical protein [Aurantiacibacter luteus]|uniref:Uncharacterized protein n=1 Tax=Aurantiacibacter luteus TaxID=1581420 RepID=A0A0G9MP40_9SPHN|nr:hypothetical protein [Aurantiacibacter luteus]KLE32475.1 hypothetical protein AAW00_13720 [Aurantiacibacter luteus]